mmetsp:Transcript_3181/g.8550  ORF Transcript_3181/g.8550 Transcript_3181/m.8550 type:complete len:87 (+) Transcript_3181:632-892(+)
MVRRTIHIITVEPPTEAQHKVQHVARNTEGWNGSCCSAFGSYVSCCTSSSCIPCSSGLQQRQPLRTNHVTVVSAKNSALDSQYDHE